VRSILQRVAVNAVCCNVSQCVTTLNSELQRATVSCSVLQRVAMNSVS